MVGASKILTVSYGTFSCTLEGFDDPFSTMKAIAEYFRDLAADDRYFGAEPPTPDAAMLHKIAEREIQRRVEAKVQDNGVILRAGDSPVEVPATPALPAAAVAAPVAAAAPAVPDTAVPETPAKATADLVDDQPTSAADESVAAKLLRIRAAVANAQKAEQRAADVKPAETVADDAAPVMDDAKAEDDEPAEAAVALDAVDEPVDATAAPGDEASIDTADEEAADVAFDTPEAADDDSDELAARVAAQLAANESAAPVNTPVDTTEAPHDVVGADALAYDDQAEDDAQAPSTVEAEADIAAFDDAELAADIAENDDEADDDFAEWDLAVEDLVAPAPADNLDDADNAAELDAAAFEPETIAEFDAVAEEAAEEHPADEAADAEYAEDDEFDIAAFDAALAAEDDDAFAEDAAAVTEDALEAVGDDEAAEFDVAEFDGDDDIAAGIAEAFEREDDATGDAGSLEADIEADYAGLQAEIAEAADEPDTGAFDAAFENAFADDTEAEAQADDELPEPVAEQPEVPAQAAEKLARARARVIRVRRDDVGRPVASTETAAEDDTLSESAEAALREELAAVEREIGETPHHAESEGRQILAASSPAGDEAMSRLLDRTNSAFEGMESRRRQSTLSHLKAAVAATQAEKEHRRLEGIATTNDDETDRYRDDLAQVVRPRRPGPAETAPKSDRMAPLVLISEQRIDKPAPAAPAAPRRPVAPSRPSMTSRPASGSSRPAAAIAPAPAAAPGNRPAQVHAVRPRRINAGNLALKAQAEEAQIDEDDDDNGDETFGTNVFEGGQSFAQFAENLGATELPDVLEAAAVYIAQVEGRPHFTRPQVLRFLSQVPQGEEASRDDTLRSFGNLLRQGRIQKLRRGQFIVPEDSHLATKAAKLAD